MEKLRNQLLMKNAISTYEAVLDFMHDPAHSSLQEIVDIAPKELQHDLQLVLNDIALTYSFDQAKFDKIYTYGQSIIWGEILRTYKELNRQKEIVNNITLSPDVSRYASAVTEVKKILTPYSKMQIALSDLEEILGVDRFLDRVSEGTFSVLKELLNSTKIIIENKCEKYKNEFQTNFNSTNVNKIIAHSIVRRNDDNQICDNLVSDNKQVILIVIDGFGFCQYLWNCGINSKNENFTFNENLFFWLSEQHLSKEFILGSSFVTDTGAGLAQIYLGEKSGKTGIFASKLKDKNSGTPYIETKKIEASQFDHLFSCPNSITDIVSTFGYDATVYYCSKYQDSPSGFSNSIFKSAKVKQIVPSERVFSILLDDIMNGQTSGLQVLYTTGIDNSGHTMGAYSGFERQEHKKIDGLLRNFIIELAFQEPELFDGKRSIIITADHGMFESSKIMITRHELIDYLNNSGARKVRLVENNRAMLFYNDGYIDNDTVVHLLEEYFQSKHVLIDIQTQKDECFKSCLLSDTNFTTLPDIVARFVGEGLFYSNVNTNEHLLHFGGHGGSSIDEVFIPLIEIPMGLDLYNAINQRFLSKK